MQIAQLRLQLGVQFQLQQSLANLGLKSIGIGTAGLDNLGNHLEMEWKRRLAHWFTLYDRPGMCLQVRLALNITLKVIAKLSLHNTASNSASHR